MSVASENEAVCQQVSMEHSNVLCCSHNDVGMCQRTRRGSAGQMTCMKYVQGNELYGS
jgi:hypothetical protein